jgi:hypothetical protein
MRIFYDCEFLEWTNDLRQECLRLEDGKTIDLISIGMSAEARDEYYAVNSDMPIERIESHGWLMKNVVPHIPGQLQERSFDDNRNLNGRFTLDPTDAIVKPHWVIANKVRDFILGQPDPQLWTWYGAYDHVALCQLWGPMASLPKGIPMGNPTVPEQSAGEHNALSDARHNRLVAYFLDSLGGR